MCVWCVFLYTTHREPTNRQQYDRGPGQIRVRGRELGRHRALQADRPVREGAPCGAHVLAPPGAAQRGDAGRRFESDLRGRRLADAIRQVAPGQRRSNARGRHTGRHERAGAAQHFELGELHVHCGLDARPHRLGGHGEGAV